jgi:hypothetical protein
MRASYDPYLILVQNTWAAGSCCESEASKSFLSGTMNRCAIGYEDWEFNIRLTQTGRPIQIHPGALYDYRIHPASMLVSSRRRHAELVAYIRRKHCQLYTAETLQKLKRQHVPALKVSIRPDEKFAIENWLSRQTFKDYVVSHEPNSPQVCRYLLLHAGRKLVDVCRPRHLNVR